MWAATTSRSITSLSRTSPDCSLRASVPGDRLPEPRGAPECLRAASTCTYRRPATTPGAAGIPIRPGTAATDRSRPWRRRAMRCGSGVPRQPVPPYGCAAGATSGKPLSSSAPKTAAARMRRSSTAPSRARRCGWSADAPCRGSGRSPSRAPPRRRGSACRRLQQATCWWRNCARRASATTAPSIRWVLGAAAGRARWKCSMTTAV